MTISPLNHLTPAEKRVVLLLLEGLENRAIAHRLVISHRTVECHISRALSKSGCRNRLELALWLIRNGDPVLNRQARAGTMHPMPA
ncbi:MULTISPECIES: response regulator transcription factor [unclassified Synechococcus]|uniref:response regulator transcription factor n=1 Tax=unclassified Synechococcus TaxID=2626047 RepID=UPI0019D00DB9|nr:MULTISPECIES: helix-turn-helix transcriptional regulator [unclassified Synechococcus]